MVKVLLVNLEGRIGGGEIYNQWHWVRGFEVYLEKGTHTLVLSNHSDHICVQTVLFIGYRGVGCAKCRFTGFHGRTAITELMILSDEIRQMTISRRHSKTNAR